MVLLIETTCFNFRLHLLHVFPVCIFACACFSCMHVDVGCLCGRVFLFVGVHAVRVLCVCQCGYSCARLSVCLWCELNTSVLLFSIGKDLLLQTDFPIPPPNSITWTPKASLITNRVFFCAYVCVYVDECGYISFFSFVGVFLFFPYAMAKKCWMCCSSRVLLFYVHWFKCTVLFFISKSV